MKPIVDFADKKFIFAANEFLSTFPLIYLKSMCQVVKLRSDKHLFNIFHKISGYSEVNVNKLLNELPLCEVYKMQLA